MIESRIVYWVMIPVSYANCEFATKTEVGFIAQASQSKYALVCGECFRHNGLVGGKYEWERMRESSDTRRPEHADVHVEWICPS
jgi:hypothetical protein